MTDLDRTASQFVSDAAADALLARAVDEFLAEDRDGGRPRVEDYAARYPAVADDLRRVLPALALVGPSDVGSASHAANLPQLPGDYALGDFRLIREIGRGGMGVVYEAEQVSLGRRVALKMLPLAATMDPRHLQRFRNEARAAASLHHPNIVPVHGVGCDRGVHYYAMQLIDGRPLTELIRERRGEPTDLPAAADTPPERADATAAATGRPAAAYFRRVAGLGAQAADALEYAHATGVVHRDVKPGNLLLDGRGNLWVADFGLPKLGADAGMTATGDVLGTLRYMSPEQALARHDLVDHRTDVYALGATLYELLTLRPAVDGADRQEILRRLATEDPAPPRTIDRRVPWDLETIVLKCMEKDPARRYPTAKELAADLRRFLEERPVRARRPTVRQRVGKWLRRNRAMTWALGAAFLVGVATLAVTTVLVAGAYEAEARRRRDAEMARTAEAVGLLLDQCEEALRADDADRAAVVLAAAERRAADGGADDLAGRLARCRADVALLRDLDAVDTFRWTAIGTKLPDTREVGIRLRAAFEKFGWVPGQTPPDEAARRVTGSLVKDRLLMALDLWFGGTHRQELLSVLRATDPDPFRDAVRAAIGATDTARLHELADRPEALDQPPHFSAILGQIPGLPIERRVRLLTAALTRWPGQFHLLMGLGKLYQTHDAAHAAERETWYRAAAAARPGNVSARLNLGVALSDKGDVDGALRVYTEATPLGAGSAVLHHNLGGVLFDKRNLDGSVEAYRTAIRLDPTLASARLNLGIALREKGDPDGAIREYREVIRLDPDDATAHCYLGNALLTKGELDGAIAEYRTAVRLDPNHADAHYDLGVALAEKKMLDEARWAFEVAACLDPSRADARYNLGVVLADLGDPDGAVGMYREALRLDPKYIDPHVNLGVVLAQRGDLDGAIAEYREAVRLDPKHIVARTNLGNTLRRNGKLPEAVRELELAIRLDPKHAPAHYNLGIARFMQGDVDGTTREWKEAVRLDPSYVDAHGNLAWLSATSSDPRFRDPAAALASARRAVELVPQSGRHWATLGVARYRNGEWNGAIEALEKSVKLIGGSNPTHLFFLAMAHEQLGQPDDARVWFARGVADVERRGSTEETMRFRTEAAEVLGVLAPPPRPVDR